MTMTITENTNATDFGAENAQKSLPPVAEAANGLEPCPFCGGEAELDEHQEYLNISTGERESAVAVYCATCGAQHSICRGDVPDIQPAEVIEMWNRRATPPVAEAVAAEQVDYPRILYVCEHCRENAPEMCGRSRDDLYVTPSGTWLCDECIDEEGVPISDCVSPPALYPASTVARLQQEIQRLKAAANKLPIPQRTRPMFAPKEATNEA